MRVGRAWGELSIDRRVGRAWGELSIDMRVGRAWEEFACNTQVMLACVFIALELCAAARSSHVTSLRRSYQFWGELVQLQLQGRKEGKGRKEGRMDGRKEKEGRKDKSARARRATEYRIRTGRRPCQGGGGPAAPPSAFMENCSEKFVLVNEDFLVNIDLV